MVVTCTTYIEFLSHFLGKSCNICRKWKLP